VAKSQIIIIIIIIQYYCTTQQSLNVAGRRLQLFNMSKVKSLKICLDISTLVIDFQVKI